MYLHTFIIVGFTICLLSDLTRVFRCVLMELYDVKYMDDIFYITSVERVSFLVDTRPTLKIDNL